VVKSAFQIAVVDAMTQHQVASKKTPLAASVNLTLLGSDEYTGGWSGADLKALVAEAAMNVGSFTAKTVAFAGFVVHSPPLFLLLSQALRRSVESSCVEMEDFLAAVQKMPRK
jgi:SpoVK/Ycf46/Vps4 family AAA+-type ATPase